jgi:hypothetical protein
MKTFKRLTTGPVQPGNLAGVMPEFGRVADVTRIYGLKRGTCYNLLRDGKIKGVLIRVRGKKSGVRLIDMVSVRDLIHSEMNADAKLKGQTRQ